MDGGVNLFLSFILNLEAKSGVLEAQQDAFLHEFVQNLNPSLPSRVFLTWSKNPNLIH